MADCISNEDFGDTLWVFAFTKEEKEYYGAKCISCKYLHSNENNQFICHFWKPPFQSAVENPKNDNCDGFRPRWWKPEDERERTKLRRNCSSLEKFTGYFKIGKGVKS